MNVKTVLLAATALFMVALMVLVPVFLMKPASGLQLSWLDLYSAVMGGGAGICVALILPLRNEQ